MVRGESHQLGRALKKPAEASTRGFANALLNCWYFATNENKR